MSGVSTRRLITVCVAAAVVAALGLSTFAESVEATWTDTVVGEYDVWSWNGAQKLRRGVTSGQWDHYSGFDSTWYVLSTPGLPATFIGDGGWYDLGNGFSYSYVVASDLAYFRKGGTSDRFAYFYTQARWLNAGNTGSWQNLGITGLSACFVGDAAPHDLKNGFSYSYVAASDLAYFKKGGTTDRFAYFYAQTRWLNAGNTGSWQNLGITGLSASFVGDAGWHDLKNGFTYSYTAASDLAYFKKGGTTYRFGYYYGLTRWVAAASTGGWQYLGAAGVSASFVGDAAWHDLKNGFTYSYVAASDLGYFKKGGTTYRFGYYYGLTRWVAAGTTGGWQYLGNAGLSASFMGDGCSHTLGNGFNYIYASDVGTFVLTSTGANRFKYSYGTGQWSDSYPPRGWKTLGNANLSAAFIGDSTYRALGQGFEYMYIGGYGYFRYDTTHHFRQSYADGSWQYLHNSTVWSTWKAATPFQDMTGSSLYTPNNFVVWNNSLYFTVGTYIWGFDGNSVTQLASPEMHWSNLFFLTANSTGLFYDITYNDGASSYHHLWRYNGTLLSDQSPTINFANTLIYLGTINGSLFFDGLTSYYDIFRWKDPSGQENMSNISNGSFGALVFMDILGTDVYFGAYTAADSGDLYKVAWNGNASVRVDDTNAHLMTSMIKANDHFYAGVWLGCSTGYELYVYRGDATSFSSVAGPYYSLGEAAEVGATLYFIAKTSSTALSDIYAYGDHLVNVTGGYFPNVDITAPWGSYLYFSGINPPYGTWSLYRAVWNTGYVPYSIISGSTAFTQALDSLGSVGTNLYVAGKDALGLEIYKCSDAAAFAEVSNNSNFSYVQFLGSPGTDVYFKAGFTTSSNSWEVYGLSGTAFAVATSTGFYESSAFTATEWVWYQGNLFFNGQATNGGGTFYNQPWHFWTQYAILSQR